MCSGTVSRTFSQKKKNNSKLKLFIGVNFLYYFYMIVFMRKILYPFYLCCHRNKTVIINMTVEQILLNILSHWFIFMKAFLFCLTTNGSLTGFTKVIFRSVS